MESESFGGACFRFAFRTFKFVVAVKNICVCGRAKCLRNDDGLVHLKCQIQKGVVPGGVGVAQVAMHPTAQESTINLR